MTIRSTVREIAERLTGFRIRRSLPRGADLFDDISRWLPYLEIGNVFDVGANVGQTVQRFKRRLPDSVVYCFEPVSTIYRQLVENTGTLADVHCFPLALGRVSGVAQIAVDGSMSRVISTTSGGGTTGQVEIDNVELATIDRFCADQQIEQIDYLKIDVEGNELEVLAGADLMFARGTIALVEVEAGMNRHNTWHVPLHELQHYLEDRGFALFGLYEQVPEWTENKPHLRRSNCLFISQTVVESNLTRA